MSKLLKCIIAEPESEASVVNIMNDMDDIKETIGSDVVECHGHINDGGSFNFYCDPNAESKGAAFNRHYNGENYYGTILISGMHEQDRSLTEKEIKHLLEALNAPEAMELNESDFAMGEMK